MMCFLAGVLLTPCRKIRSIWPCLIFWINHASLDWSASLDEPCLQRQELCSNGLNWERTVLLIFYLLSFISNFELQSMVAALAALMPLGLWAVPVSQLLNVYHLFAVCFFNCREWRSNMRSNNMIADLGCVMQQPFLKNFRVAYSSLQVSLITKNLATSWSLKPEEVIRPNSEDPCLLGADAGIVGWKRGCCSTPSRHRPGGYVGEAEEDVDGGGLPFSPASTIPLLQCEEIKSVVLCFGGVDFMEHCSREV